MTARDDAATNASTPGQSPIKNVEDRARGMPNAPYPLLTKEGKSNDTGSPIRACP